MRQHGRITGQPDFRTDKSDSVEGAGKAVARWRSYHGALDEDVLAEAFPMQALDTEDYSDLVRDDIAEDAMEQSELIGSGSTPSCTTWATSPSWPIRVCRART